MSRLLDEEARIAAGLSVELPGIEPNPEIALSWGRLDLRREKHAKRPQNE
jgi:hypothetical protein